MPYLPVSEITKKYSVTKGAVYNWIKDGNIPCKTEKIIGRRARKIVDIDALESYLNVGIREEGNK